MGTLVKVTVYARDEDEARAAFDAAFSRIRALDERLSDYKAESELNRVTRGAVGQEVEASGDLIAVLSASQQLAAATNGAFDVTQGPVIRLWREARRSGRLPAADALRAASSRSGFRKLHVDAVRKTVRVDVEGMQLDVGAIGKGYAASEALAAIGRMGLRSALVAVSGDLAFSEAPPGRAGWRIDLPAESDTSAVPRILELTNAAVSTSGPSEQHADIDGRRYSHIVDPATAAALTEDLTVTVIAKHGLDADGLDTAVSVIGVQRGLSLIDSRPGAAALIVRRSAAGVELLSSARFPAFVTIGR